MNVLYWKLVSRIGFVISLYRSPNQSKDDFDQFFLNFEQLISARMSRNPHFKLVTRDFNVRLFS